MMMVMVLALKDFNTQIDWRFLIFLLMFFITGFLVLAFLERHDDDTTDDERLVIDIAKGASCEACRGNKSGKCAIHCRLGKR